MNVLRAIRCASLWVAFTLAISGCSANHTTVETRTPATDGIAAAHVARVWHGKTPSAKADEYAQYLYEVGVKKLREIPGNLGVQMFRENRGNETDFVVISYWYSRDEIHAYAGADISKTHHLPRDAEFLVEIEPEVRHYDIAATEQAGDAKAR